MKGRKNMTASGRCLLLLLAGLLCLLLLSACVKYFPREEQSSEQPSMESTATEECTSAPEEEIPNLPSDDATKRY